MEMKVKDEDKDVKVDEEEKKVVNGVEDEKSVDVKVKDEKSVESLEDEESVYVKVKDEKSVEGEKDKDEESVVEDEMLLTEMRRQGIKKEKKTKVEDDDDLKVYNTPPKATYMQNRRMRKLKTDLSYTNPSLGKLAKTNDPLTVNPFKNLKMSCWIK
ncbi:dynein heavy chain-like protein PF11_0240 [Impatiens glandulifera]|uniref:dynein heavy chain-like protein PF11_0240 n=1 Tax=Impatiens glandulifera TaxID=253017 RepID=UPI001FB10D89|nr:dynein heavy chain-like protein PF11_0240 [Impatiens glandulifera]